MEDDQQLQEFVAAMPKVELHAHLNGCIREDTLFALAQERNVVLSSGHFEHHHPQPQDENKNYSTSTSYSYSYSYSYMYNVRPRSLKDCFEMFVEIPKAVDDRRALERITREALEDFANHHVVYLELRSTPKRMKDLTKQEYIETIVRVLQEFESKEEQRYQAELESSSIAAPNNNNNNHNNNNHNNCQRIRLPMKCRFLVSIDRSGTVQEADENVSLAIRLSSQQTPNSIMVVGVDIGGNPTKNDFRDFEPAVARARQAGLKVTVHCAEVPVGENDSQDQDPQLRKSYQEVSAIFNFQPDRIGHALLLPPSVRDAFMMNNNNNNNSNNNNNHVKIPVESCPTSNVMTLELAKHMEGNLIHGLQQHPQLQYWLESKYPISIGTDDPGVFNTNATQELLLLARAWNVSQEQLQQIVLDSIDHGFCSDELKYSIKHKMKEFFAKMKTSC